VIDRTVEPLVREVFTAVVAGDSDRFERALQAIPENRAKYAISLALAIDRTVMRDLHKAEGPSDERLTSLADSFIKMQDWYRVDGLPVQDFFRLLADAPTNSIEAGAVGLLSFLTGGWLLVVFLDKETPWYTYLDGILERLDAEPGEVA
jgi:hypothetical protein